MTEIKGGVVLKGQILRKPVFVGLTNETFKVTAAALAGTLQYLATGKLRVVAAGRTGPPIGPAGPLVSTIRHGASGVYVNGPPA